MILVTKTHSTNDDYNADCDYCIIAITKEVAETILKRRKAFLKMKETDKDLQKMFFWGGTQEMFHGQGLEDGPSIEADKQYLTEEQAELLEDNRWVALPDDFKGPEDFQRTECDMMVITEDGVWWSSMPKYYDGCMYISSESVGYEVIEEALAKG